jgi:thiol:disulfide interchange protein DsbD
MLPEGLFSVASRRRLVWQLLGGLVSALVCLGPTQAQFATDPGVDHAHASLVSATDALVPGKTNWVGIRIRHDAHWHTYWVNAGDAGLPTRVQWTLDHGVTAGDIQWPLPQRMVSAGLANYGYDGTVVLPVAIAVPAATPPGTILHLQGRVDWLVCNDMCIPGGGSIALDLPVRGADQTHVSSDAPAIAAARARVPQTISLKQLSVRHQGTSVTLSFDADPSTTRWQFFPLQNGTINGAHEPAVQRHERLVTLRLAAADPFEGKSLHGVLVANDGMGNPGGWAGIVQQPLGDVVTKGSPTSGGIDAPPSSAADPGASNPATPTTVPQAAPAPASRLTLGLSILGAFLGGLILNLMPCVFPVLSLKLMALVQHRTESPARMRGHGYAFAAGVVLSFVALATLLIVLRTAGDQIGWGFQLQSPVVVSALITLFFLIGINLLGAFEFTLGSSLINRVAGGSTGSDDGESMITSFSTGVLAAVVASPCTAPFMGAALGFALTQASVVSLLIFASLGLGMAAPYVVLTHMPTWLARLPRPGAWMEHMKQIMAFPMFLTCVWLFWVLGQQADITAAAGVLMVLVVVALWAWSTGLAQRGAPRYRWLARAALVVAAFSTLAVWPLLRGDAQVNAAADTHGSALVENGWQAWNPTVQQQALAAHTPVFVDFTAAWCITCQANKKLVLHNTKVQAAFRAHGVSLLLADWTRRDESISAELTRFARSGVPLYVYYDATGKAHVLPEILSVDGVLDTLAAAGRS